MYHDPIVEEIRRIRHEHAARFNNDLDAIFEDLRRRQRESGKTSANLPRPNKDDDRQVELTATAEPRRIA